MVWGNWEKGKPAKAAAAVADFPVHPFQWIPKAHLEFWNSLEFPCGFFLSFPLRTLLTICGLWRIWKLLPVSKINSFKTRAQEGTNHLFHQAWLISEVLQLVPFEVPFAFIFYFFSASVQNWEAHTHMCPARGWGWRGLLWSLCSLDVGGPDDFGKLSQILKMWFKSSWDVSQSTLASVESGAVFLSESWIEKRRKKKGEEKTPRAATLQDLSVFKLLSLTPAE